VGSGLTITLLARGAYSRNAVGAGGSRDDEVPAASASSSAAASRIAIPREPPRAD